ncbi:MAG: aminoglycoside phosphotransferase family protein [Patescibacteria group bacterium]
MEKLQTEPTMEKGKEAITVNGIAYNYLKDRLMGGDIYVNTDRTAYLRTHSAAEIAGELNITRDLHERGFPVPEVLAEGVLPTGESYFIESSIGDRNFADQFTEETKENGVVSDATFDAFTEAVKKYCEAQFNPKNFVPQNKEAMAQMIALANVIRNNPPSEEMREPFMEAIERASERSLSLPWGYIQADLNAYNILPNGVIDFELASFGPVGYDGLTNVFFGRMWPEGKVRYRFSNEQIARYIAELDSVAIAYDLPKLSEYSDDFLVLKTIWASGKDKGSEEDPTSNPDFWAWRVKMRDWCIQQYLKGEKIDTDLFEEVGNK